MSFIRLFAAGALITVSLVAVHAQHVVEGVIMTESVDGSFSPLDFVNVYDLTDKVGTYTDSTGYFKLELPDRGEGHIDQIVVSYVGFEPDTIVVTDQHYISIVLKDNTVLDEVEVVHRKRTSEVSFLDPRLVENISQEELFKAACCNLSESFETNASVDVSFTDAITGAKELQMLGLAGKYTMISREGLPGIRGLAVPYGLLYTPGSWIQSMQVTKGSGTVQNGYESIAGQINVEWKKPEGDEKLHLNGYINRMLRSELNANASFEVSPKLQTEVLAHTHINPSEFDRNDDGFVDQATGEMFVLSNRWKYNNGKGVVGQVNAAYTYDDKTGGQVGYSDDTESLYGVTRDTRQIDVWGKLGYVFAAKRYQSFGLQWSFMDYKQDMVIGDYIYNGKQRTGYANLMFQSLIGTTTHKYKVGLSVLHDSFDEDLNQLNFARNETATGVFMEYTYAPTEKMTAVLGFRADYNNIHGMLYTPRGHFRYAFTDNTTIRASFGRGYRSPNVIAENISVLASSRQIILMGDEPDLPMGLKMESSWNYGVSLFQEFFLDFRPGSVSVEFFRTQFTNQAVVDLDVSPQQALIYNLEGQSYSNNFQIETSWEVLKRIDLKLAYRRSDVKTDYQEGLLNKPLVAKDRGFANLSYTTRQGDKGYWMFDGTLQIIGEQRLPSTASNPEGLQRPDRSPAFVTFNTQITRSFNVGRSGTKTALDVYIGAENLFDYRQKDPILGADDPFGPYFDSGLVWGPIFGRNIYAGVRYTLDKKDK